MPGAWVNFRRRSDRLWLLGAFLLLLLVLLNTWRVPISEKLVPDPRLNRNLERAELALRKGELSRGDGSGAKELFESVLAVDPDQGQARQGLLAVRNAALTRAAEELRRHRLEEARRDLEIANALAAPQVQLQPLHARLRQLEEASIDVPALLARAAAPGVGDDEALALLEQVLALDAGNALALEGRQELFAGWLLEAEHDLDAGRVDAARARIERVQAADPGHVDLPPLLARLGEFASMRERGATQELARARAHEAAGRDSAAVAIYERLAKDNAEAREALARIQAAREQRERRPHTPAAREARREAVRTSSACFRAAMAAGRPRAAQDCLEAWQAEEPAGAAVDAARAELAERWLALADERIGASDWKAAREALAAARRWQPTHPRLPAVAERLRRAGGN